MGRTSLLLTLCFTLALLGVCGTHAHMPGVDHAQTSSVEHAHAHETAYTVSVTDADHFADHDDDGDIDIDPLAKAFGKVSLDIFFFAIAILCGLVALARPDGYSLRLPLAPPLRPPKRRRRAYLLPPSQAPPTLLI
jgi:hypothetical protein